ncbi:MAG: T9SS type A sorting domain-containing protein [Paludibacter sp.]
MKKLTPILFILSVSFMFIQAENKTVKDTLSKSSNQTDPWTREVGLRYSMPILVRVYKNNILFQPTGALLGIFKDNKCWGYAGLGNSPVGLIFNVTMGYNLESETGFNYKLYDPTSKLTYSILETVDFQDGVPVGQIQAPISINISGISALNDINKSQFSIFPNPVESEFKISLGFDTQENTLIQLYNTSGQMVSVLYNGETTNNQEVVIRRDNKITKGIYFIKVNNGLKFSTQKIILK